jgi:hypothetical protein
MPKTKKNFNYMQNKNKNMKIEVDDSVPTYSDLNAFMRPSKISPRYQHLYQGNDNLSESDNESLSSSSSSSSNQSQISESLYDIEPEEYDTKDNADIAESDKNIYNMKCILEKKKLLLLEKNREVKELSKQNSFLNSVLSDYDKIKSHILEEKRKQQSAIKIISKHISQISKNMNEEDYHVGQLQDDQSMLLEELEKIKMEMKEVMRS